MQSSSLLSQFPRSAGRLALKLCCGTPGAALLAAACPLGDAGRAMPLFLRLSVFLALFLDHRSKFVEGDAKSSLGGLGYVCASKLERAGTQARAWLRWRALFGSWHAFHLVFPYANEHFPIQCQDTSRGRGQRSFPLGTTDQAILPGEDESLAAWM